MCIICTSIFILDSVFLYILTISLSFLHLCVSIAAEKDPGTLGGAG